MLARVREAGASQPAKLDQFEKAYRLAQQLWPLKEDHSYYIDQASTALVRIALAEAGRRAHGAGAIASADDVWFITLPELEAALHGKPPDGLKVLVQERRSDRQRFSRLTPPKYLGTFPPGHEAANGHQPAAEVAGTLRGTAASRGEATGTARVVMSPADFPKVQRGDVLVCRSTAPMWTPLFEVVSALVSEAGGILSHPAVVAREFGLPAVVGVAGATQRIADGQPVTVSGTEGLVHLPG
jgi:pyruvate,water dikinase